MVTIEYYAHVINLKKERKRKVMKNLTTRVVVLLLAIAMVFGAFSITAAASIPNWEDNNVVFEGTSFGTNGYYNVISKKDYVLVPGAAVESEMVINNAAGTRRQVLHIIEVDPSNPDVSIVPGYYQIDKLAEDPNNEAYWSHKELTEMAKYYENNLGYNIVGGMNTDLYYNSYSPRVLVYNGEWIGNAHENVATEGAMFNPTQSILYVFKDAEGNVSCDVKAYNKAQVEQYLADGVLLHAVGVSFGMVVKDGPPNHKPALIAWRGNTLFTERPLPTDTAKASIAKLTPIRNSSINFILAIY